MDPVEPWIDGDAVRRLAAQLISSPDGSEIADSPDAGFGPWFEGFTSGVPEVESGLATSTSVPVARSAQAAELPVPPAIPPAVPQEAVEVASQQEEPEAKPFMATATTVEVPPDSGDEAADHPFQSVSHPVAETSGDARRGPLMDRMLRFRDWLRRNAKARSVFVLDREGQPVLDDPAYAKLHFLARSLSQAYRPVPGQPGNVHVKVGSDAYLVVIPVETAFGCLVLGTVLQRPLDAPSVEIVAKALADAARPGNP